MSDERSRATIVLVDDDEMVLSSLKTLLSLETDHDVQAFASPQEALAFGAEHPADAVVSDYLMPGMDGIEFLKRFREARPDAPRILLTGYADKENAIKAINEVGLFQYIEKPWDNENLLLVLRNAVERTRLARSLQEKIDEIEAAQGRIQGLRTDILRTFI